MSQERDIAAEAISMIKTEAGLEHIARLALAKWADIDGTGRARRSQNALDHAPPGWTGIDDSDAEKTVRDLMARGKSRGTAINIVTKKLPAPDRESAKRRFRRKVPK